MSEPYDPNNANDWRHPDFLTNFDNEPPTDTQMQQAYHPLYFPQSQAVPQQPSFVTPDQSPSWQQGCQQYDNSEFTGPDRQGMFDGFGASGNPGYSQAANSFADSQPPRSAVSGLAGRRLCQ